MPLDVLPQPATAGLPALPALPPPPGSRSIIRWWTSSPPLAARSSSPWPRGRAQGRQPLEALGDALGAVLATSAMVHCFRRLAVVGPGSPGGFALPLAARLHFRVRSGLAFGASLPAGTTKDGSLLAGAKVVHVDVERGRRPPAGRIADRRRLPPARALLDAGVRTRCPRCAGCRDRCGSWRDEPYGRMSGGDGHIDPAHALDRAGTAPLPTERTVAVDSWDTSMEFPATTTARARRPPGFVFTQAGTQPIGLGLVSRDRRGDRAANG